MNEPLVAIVDDDEAIGSGVSSLLRSAGFKVAVFASAEDFLESPRALEVACVLTDVQMPGMSGLELLDLLRETRPELPVLIMTAFPTGSIEARALAAGAVSFLSKPFEAAALLDALHRTLGVGI
jgi:FixJ family two-component response regulator